jgi:hypothetical protein
MPSETQLFDQIVTQIRELSPESRLRLIQLTAQTLTDSSLSPSPMSPHYGRCYNDSFPPWEDFISVK